MMQPSLKMKLNMTFSLQNGTGKMSHCLMFQILTFKKKIQRDFHSYNLSIKADSVL